jgi:hypothetical protein
MLFYTATESTAAKEGALSALVPKFADVCGGEEALLPFSGIHEGAVSE